MGLLHEIIPLAKFICGVDVQFSTQQKKCKTVRLWKTTTPITSALLKSEENKKKIRDPWKRKQALGGPKEPRNERTKSFNEIHQREKEWSYERKRGNTSKSE